MNLIIPRQWVPRHGMPDYGSIRIAQAVRDSRPPSFPKAMGLFWQQSRAARRRNGRRGAASRLASRFAANVK